VSAQRATELVAEAAVRGAGTLDTAADGQRALKPGRQCYVDNDARMWSAKQQYGTRIASIFVEMWYKR